MIIGVGIDVVDVDAVRAVAGAHARGWRERLFTDGRAASCRPPPWPPGSRPRRRWRRRSGAPVGLRWRDAEVHRGEDGRPHLDGRAARWPRGPRRSASAAPHLSLSHDAGIASRRRHRARAEPMRRGATTSPTVRAAEQPLLGALPEGTLMAAGRGRAGRGSARGCSGGVYGAAGAAAGRRRRQRRRRAATPGRSWPGAARGCEALLLGRPGARGGARRAARGPAAGSSPSRRRASADADLVRRRHRSGSAAAAGCASRGGRLVAAALPDGALVVAVDVPSGVDARHRRGRRCRPCAPT